MGENTEIAWADHTHNIVWGCVKVSPGCKNCYAETLSKRHGHDVWGPGTDRRILSDAYWKNPLTWDRKAEKAGEIKRVFTSSMADVFEDHPDIDRVVRERLWPLIRQTPNLIWMILTKRADRIDWHLPTNWGDGYPNVWLGVSIESQDYESRATALARIPARIRFVSYEPALGPLDLRRWFGYYPVHGKHKEDRRGCLSCGYQWRTGDRLQGENLADRGMAVEQMAQGSHIPSMSTQESRESDRSGIPADQEDGEREEASRLGEPTSVQAFRRSDSKGTDDQSQERSQGRQSTIESRSGDIQRATQTQDNSGKLRSERREEPSLQADRCPSCGDPKTTIFRGDLYLDRKGLWHPFPARLKDRSPAAPLITWTIFGGESGPGFRASDPAWARMMRDDCRESGVAFFHKQSAGPRPGTGVPLDGEIIQEVPRSGLEAMAEGDLFS